MTPTRREFLKTSLKAGALIGFPTIIPASVLGNNGNVAPSNRVTIGVIGCGARSAACMEYVKYAKSEILGVCDPFADRRANRAAEWNVQDQYIDFRELLSRDDIDAVHIVTPDHWHVPIALAAARAGKDIYCEKPLGISIEQDLAAREIVEKHDRVFQYGTQQRSTKVCRVGLELVLNGHIGEVQELYVWAPGGSAGGGSATPEAVPEGLDYEMWLGPAKETPYSADRVSRKGSYFNYDYTLGFIAGWGAHPLDQLQWWADHEGLDIPVEYETTGKIAPGPICNTAHVWDMHSTYANGVKMRFMDPATARSLGAEGPEGIQKASAKHGDGTLFIGTNGWVNVSRGALHTSSDEIRRMGKDPGPIRLPESRNHFFNFIDCVLERKQPIAPLSSGVRSDIISHIADIGIRAGGTLRWDPEEETIVGNAGAVEMMHRPMRAPWTL